MSFSNDCKTEILAQDFSEYDSAEALLYGFSCFFPNIMPYEMSISSENREMLETMVQFYRRFDVPEEAVSVIPGKRIHSLKIQGESVCQDLINRFQISRFVPFSFLTTFLETEEQRKAFLSGVFLAAGTLSSPSTGYHLQFTSHRLPLIRALDSFLNENGFTPKLSRHGSHYMLYIKSSEQIEDFLTYLGAFDNTLKLMQEKVLKDVRNTVTRRVNCENANLEKTIQSSAKDVSLLTEFLEKGGEVLLSEEQLRIVRYRIENPEYSLAELASEMDDSVTKSGINHRLRRIREIARDYLEKNEH